MIMSPYMPGMITNNICPPIPIRQFDWCAYLDDDEGGPVGYGATEAAAILELEDLLYDRDMP